MAAHPSEQKTNFFSAIMNGLLGDENPQVSQHAHTPPQQTTSDHKVLRVSTESRLNSVFYYPKNWDDILLAANDLKVGNEVVVNVTRLNGSIRDLALCYLRGVVDALNAPWRQASEDVFQFGVAGTSYTNATESGTTAREPEFFMNSY